MKTDEYMGVAYRPNDHIQFLDSLQASHNEVLAAGYDNIIITGYLNADPSTPDGRKLLYFIDRNNFTKHVKEPTRITDRSSSELDQIVSNCDYLIQDVMVSPPVSYNDHNTVSASIKFHIRNAKAFQRIMWQYDMTNFDGFRQRLSDVNWEHCFTSNDVDTAAQAWTDMLMNAARECIPNKLVTVRPRDKPFFNGYLRRLRRSRSVLTNGLNMTIHRRHVWHLETNVDLISQRLRDYIFFYLFRTEDVGWPSLQSRRKQHQLTLFYKIVNGLSPPYLTTLLYGRVGERTRYALLSSHKLTQPMCRTQIYSRSFIPSTVDDWNRRDQYGDWQKRNLGRGPILLLFTVPRMAQYCNRCAGTS